jgi:hypothetical protein
MANESRRRGDSIPYLTYRGGASWWLNFAGKEGGGGSVCGCSWTVALLFMAAALGIRGGVGGGSQEEGRRAGGRLWGGRQGGGGAAGEAHRGVMALLVAHGLWLAAGMQGGWRAVHGHAGEGDGAAGQGRAKARTG